ncbi:hypothetical protein O1L68_42810 [Streptomyces lydicus]|nr:hypothetical protein [Streptomyces lydicus]
MAFLLLGAWMIEVMPTADAEDRVEHRGFRRIVGPLFFGAFRLLMCCAAMIGVTIGAMAILGGRLTESNTSVGGVGILLSLHGCGAFIGALTLSGGDTEKIGNLTKRLIAVLLAFSASWALAAPFFPVLVQESSFFFAGFFMGPALTWTFALVNASIPKRDFRGIFLARRHHRRGLVGRLLSGGHAGLVVRTVGSGDDDGRRIDTGGGLRSRPQPALGSYIRRTGSKSVG